MNCPKCTQLMDTRTSSLEQSGNFALPAIQHRCEKCDYQVTYAVETAIPFALPLAPINQTVKRTIPVVN